jgi:hypothetical protein
MARRTIPENVFRKSPKTKLAHLKFVYLLHGVQPSVGRFRDAGVPISCGLI